MSIKVNARCQCGYIRGESAGVRICDNCDRVSQEQLEGRERTPTEYDKAYQAVMREREKYWYSNQNLR